MRSLQVKTSKEYRIIIEDDIQNLKKEIFSLFSGDKIAVITDDTVKKLYYKEMEKIFSDKNVFLYSVKSGEKSKNAKNYLDILNFLAENGFDRKDCIITFGGGVVGDLGGFVASTYMRGIKLFAVPTTLLSMVDSSIGGKTAINLKEGKNLCGTFYQPDLVYISLSFLSSLKKQDLLCGLGEILKYKFIDKTKKIDINTINADLIYNCLLIKKEIVEKDERESGERKLLNFGHTFGHAIEKAYKFKIPHGICVAKGIVYALKISEKYFGLEKEVLSNYIKTAEQIGFDLSCDITDKVLIENIKNDKKKNGDTVDFVLADKDLKLKIVGINISEIEKYL